MLVLGVGVLVVVLMIGKLEEVVVVLTIGMLLDAAGMIGMLLVMMGMPLSAVALTSASAGTGMLEEEAVLVGCCAGAGVEMAAAGAGARSVA
jgi:hypothetical protein